MLRGMQMQAIFHFYLILIDLKLCICVQKKRSYKLSMIIFHDFGYKICKLENPNISGRRYWNYIEIGGSEEIGTGEVPSKFMEIINNACRKGVTIWHDHSNIGDYSLNNTIVQ